MLVNNVKGSDKDRELEKRLLELYGFDIYQGSMGAQYAWDKMPNREEVDESRFWGHRSSYSFKAEYWFGHINTDEIDPTTAGKSYQHPKWGTLILYLVDHSSLAGGGFAVVYHFNDRGKPGAVRYFEWKQCDHDKHGWTTRNTGNCLNTYTCKGCGYCYEVDSSG